MIDEVQGMLISPFGEETKKENERKEIRYKQLTIKTRSSFEYLAGLFVRQWLREPNWTLLPISISGQALCLTTVQMSVRLFVREQLTL